jgi:tRNA modification GTPase
VIEEVINLRGIPLHLIDTAGVRESSDEIECEGMERTRRAVRRADLVLHIADATQPNGSSGHIESSAPTVAVLNKIDLGENETWQGVDAVRVSCVTGAGFDALAGAIEERIFGGGAAHRDWTIAINARHQSCLERALDYLRAARNAFDQNLSPEFVAEELRAALDAVGEVAGKADSEELLGVIFGRFCIGK